MSLYESKITVETVEQNLERVVQSLEVMLLCSIFFRPHFRFRFQTERVEIGEQMAEDLQLIGHRKTIEFQHDRRIERSDVAVPDVVRNSRKEDVGVTALERAHHWQLGNGMALPEIFAQEQRINPRRVAAHDHVLIIVGKNLGLDEVTRA